MQMGKGTTAVFANEKEVHQFSVIGNEREIVVFLKKRFADLKPQNSLVSRKAHVGGQIGPGTGKQMALKGFLLHFPPVFSADKCDDEKERGRGGSKVTVPAILFCRQDGSRTPLP